MLRIIAGAVLVAMLAPLVPAQPAQPVTNCRPVECDPLTANGGEVRTQPPVRTMLFAHMQDCLQDAPLNTQPPDPEHEPDVNCGFMMPTVNSDLPCGPCNLQFVNNRFTLFSSPGPVGYTRDGWRIHHEQGMAETVRFAGDGMMGYWYLSARSVPDNVAPLDAGVMPLVGVYIRMETGRYYQMGELIAEGDTGSGHGDPSLGGISSATTMINLPGWDVVYEFRVPMRLFRDDIPGRGFVSDPKQEGFTVTVVPYQVHDETTGTFVTGAEWRTRSGDDFRPRLVMDVKNPLVHKSGSVNTLDGAMYFRWSFVSPWGAYDLDPESLRLSITGPVAVKPEAIEFVKLKYSIDHAGQFKPVNAIWRYNHTAQPLPDGLYALTASVLNGQGTYRLYWNQSFEMRSGKPVVPPTGAAILEGDAVVPGLELVGGLVAATSALFLRRRLR